MHFRDIALATGIQFAFDLTQLPAAVHDELVAAINSQDKRVVRAQREL